MECLGCPRKIKAQNSPVGKMHVEGGLEKPTIIPSVGCNTVRSLSRLPYILVLPSSVSSKASPSSFFSTLPCQGCMLPGPGHAFVHTLGKAFNPAPPLPLLRRKQKLQ